MLWVIFKPNTSIGCYFKTIFKKAEVSQVREMEVSQTLSKRSAILTPTPRTKILAFPGTIYPPLHILT
jgi:hypothetical protein